MSQPDDKLASDLSLLQDAAQRGPFATLGAWVRLSGPGWLQSAITLGGGSLASSLYLGVLAGFAFLWVQPLFMALGIVMLAAIAWVTLSTGERPFGAIRRHVNPVLAWGWALATLAANVVWSLPQYALASGVLRQNLAPGIFGPKGVLGDFGGKLALVIGVLVLTIALSWSYGAGRGGVKLFERLLKLCVAAIVLCFIGVVVRLAGTEQGLDWGAIFAGFVPDLGAFSRPADKFVPLLESLSATGRAFWEARIVGEQRDVMIAAAATAVGINMTFLLPYSMLARGWRREFRGLAAFDLATGMLLPFLLATSCVVIASASRFHATPVPGLASELAAGEVAPTDKMVGAFDGLLAARADHDGALVEALPQAELELAAMLVKRDAFDLAQALAPLTGDFFANVIFGLGVLAMALSTITILMLISGFVVCEMLGLEPEGWAHRIGSLAACSGALGPFLWSKAAPWLAVPTSVFGMMLLPLAYWTFVLMLNSKDLMGEHRPRGRARTTWNALLLPAASIATAASLWSVNSKAGWKGLSAVGVFLALAIVAHLREGPGGGRRPRTS